MSSTVKKRKLWAEVARLCWHDCVNAKRSTKVFAAVVVGLVIVVGLVCGLVVARQYADVQNRHQAVLSANQLLQDAKFYSSQPGSIVATADSLFSITGPNGQQIDAIFVPDTKNASQSKYAIQNIDPIEAGWWTINTKEYVALTLSNQQAIDYTIVADRSSKRILAYILMCFAGLILVRIAWVVKSGCDRSVAIRAEEERLNELIRQGREQLNAMLEKNDIKLDELVRQISEQFFANKPETDKPE